MDMEQWTDMEGFGRTNMVMDIRGWTKAFMEDQINDVVWQERAYIVMERIEMAWRSV